MQKPREALGLSRPEPRVGYAVFDRDHQAMTRASFILLAVFALSVGPFSVWGQMPATAVARETLDAPFYVAGWQVRTNNADEMGGAGKIGPLWQRFMQQNLAAQIPNRIGDALIVVYSDYASDEKGDYDYLLGARVSSVDNLPAGMTWKKVEPGRYAVILTEKGQMPGVLQTAWARIWKMTPAELGGKRAFLTDYEIYDQRSANMQTAQVEIHVSLVATSR
jgi:predicted transcriptional regulator YdeE